MALAKGICVRRRVSRLVRSIEIILTDDSHERTNVVASARSAASCQKLKMTEADDQNVCAFVGTACGCSRALAFLSRPLAQRGLPSAIHWIAPGNVACSPLRAYCAPSGWLVRFVRPLSSSHVNKLIGSDSVGAAYQTDLTGTTVNPAANGAGGAPGPTTQGRVGARAPQPGAARWSRPRRRCPEADATRSGRQQPPARPD
jgi:hypothetical protein